MPYILKILKTFFSLILLIIFISCQEKKLKIKEFTILGETQGTTYAIKYYAEKEMVAKNEIDQILKQFDLSLSTYITESIVSKINRNETVKIDSFFKHNFLLAKDIYQLTKGKFDPTIGTLVNAYGFGPDKTKQIKNESDIKKYLSFVGFDKVKLENDQVKKPFPETYLDFNAIAQGYAVDILADYVKSKNIKDAIVEIGGEVYAFGQNIDKQKPWVVGIEDPVKSDEQAKVILEKVDLKNKGLATSGNYRKIKTDSISGKKFVHIINPITGEATQTSILSATVVSDSTAKSDALATALMLMTIEEIKTFSDQNKTFYILVVYQNEKNEVKIFKSQS
jgi:thiamine biosynthesis lipoprotein